MAGAVLLGYLFKVLGPCERNCSAGSPIYHVASYHSLFLVIKHRNLPLNNETILNVIIIFILKESFMTQQFFYPTTPWQIIEENLIPKLMRRMKPFCIVQRQHWCAAPKKGIPAIKHRRSTASILMGFMSLILFVIEGAYGYAKANQTMLNVTNSRYIKLYIDDEMFHMFADNILEYNRVLDMQKGFTQRHLFGKLQKGKSSHRHHAYCPLTRQHLAAIRFESDSA